MQRTTAWLVLIAFVTAAAAFVVAPGTGLNLTQLGIPINVAWDFRQGLDLQGGLQVLLEADVPPGTPIDPEAMRVAQQIVEQRVNALGLTEPIVQTQGERQDRIVVELPGESNPENAIATIRETGLLEFVAVGFTPLPPGTEVVTDCADPSHVDCGTAGAIETPTQTVTGTVYHTVMTGVALRTANVAAEQLGGYRIDFDLTNAGWDLFGAYTSAHVGEYLAIVLDKTVISSPQIQSAITTGPASITGNFTAEEANQLALQLRYGALPVPLKVVESRVVGPSLGQDSLNKSLVAGLIGLSVVVLFMILYYRLPGVVADLAILFYALVTLALFKLIPGFTLTLAGIAGFLLSTGSALDANILIFERLKEELRHGRGVQNALAPAWRRAWPSIRDSNFATIIICLILFWFGSAFGASVVKGFALTLLIGVLISLFTAVVVTRNLLTAAVRALPVADRLQQWFGV